MAVLNAVTLIIQGEPWKLTSAFTLWGAKVVTAIDIDVSSWGYREKPGSLNALHTSIFRDSTSVLNTGVILGTFTALSLRGKIKFGKIPLKVSIAALSGGLLMGYGACLASGSNVGAYFSGIASFSLHGWIWAIMAIIGTYAGLKLQPFLERIIFKSSE